MFCSNKTLNQVCSLDFDMKSKSCFPSALKELIYAKSKPWLFGKHGMLAENSTLCLGIFSVPENKKNPNFLSECLGFLTLSCYDYKRE